MSAEYYTSLFQRECISFPYKRLYMNTEDVVVAFSNIKHAILTRKFDASNYIRPFIREKGIDILDVMGEGIVSYTRNVDDYTRMEWLTDYFTESSRMKAYRTGRGKQISPYEEWYSYGDYVCTSISRTLEAGTNITSFMDRVKSYDREIMYSLREGLYCQKNIEECSNESPIFLGMLYRFLGAKRIFDATAGWGDRMLAAISIDAEKYLGIDPNTNSSAGLYEMVERLGGEDHNRYSVLCKSMPCDIFIEDNESYDIGFMSPPSYDSEMYSQDPGQSISLFGNKGIWMEEFIEKTILCTLQKIRIGGYLIIQSILIEEIIPFIRGKCDFDQPFKLAFVGPISIGNVPTPQQPSPRYKPMWIWRKVNDTSSIPSERLSSLEYYSVYLRSSTHELSRVIPTSQNIPLQEFFGMHSHMATFLREHSLVVNIIPGHRIAPNLRCEIAALRARAWGDDSFNSIEKWKFKDDLRSIFILIKSCDTIIGSTCIIFHNNLAAISSARWLAKRSLHTFHSPAASIERLVVDKSYQYTTVNGVIVKGGMGKLLDILAINIISLTDVAYVYCDVPSYRIKTLTSLGFSGDMFHTKCSKSSNIPDVEWSGMLLTLGMRQRGKYNVYVKYSDYAVFIPSLAIATHTYFISGDSELMKGALRFVLEYLSPLSFKEVVCEIGECSFVSQEWVRGTSRIIHAHTEMKCTIKNMIDGKTSITNKWELWRNFKKYFPSKATKFLCKSRLLKNVKCVKTGEVIIVRPIGHGACSGNDISIVRTDEELAAAKILVSKYSSAMVSEYIINPLLFHSKKFHLRMYYAVTILDNETKSYLFGIGKILTSHKPYDLSDMSKDVHDTHADSTTSNIWFPYDIEFHDTKKMYDDMMEVCKCVTRILLRDGNMACYPESKNGYEVFGCDFMFDSENNVKLLEINDKVGYTTILEPFEIGDSVHTISPYIDRSYRRSFLDLISREDAFIDHRIDSNMTRHLTFGLFSELFYKFIHDIAIYRACST